MVDQLTIKKYKCDRCGKTEFLYSSPLLSKERNVIAKACTECFFGYMIIDFDDDLNFKDNDFLERYCGV